MFESIIDNNESGRLTKYRITRNGIPLTYLEVLNLWCDDADFREFFIALLADSNYSAYRWETPALNETTAKNDFEFVLLDCPSFSSRETDTTTYQEYFTSDDVNHGIISFTNLRGDATLIVPSPRTEVDAYGHLAAFHREAPAMQRNAFWRVIGKTVISMLSSKTIWLSTAGGGVAWLHVRIDARPKYYAHSTYKS